MDEQSYAGPSALETAPFLTVSALLMMLRSELPGDGAGAEETEDTDRTRAEVLRCVQHIQANYDQALSAEVLSGITALPRSAINKAFRQYTGKSVKQYVTEVRIKEAKRLIGLGELPLQQVGYRDFSTFYRNFLKLAGVSPAEYRRSNSHSASEEDPTIS